jgi:restriction endonuclease S subunit
MKKNGLTFISVIPSDQLQSGVWNPYRYKYAQEGEYSTSLSDFAKIEKVNGKKMDIKYFVFAPIEYKHIPKGDLLNFALEEKSDILKGKFPFVETDILLFGTMRAYLGNTCVTPSGDWIGRNTTIKYAVNSEFVKIRPFDNCNYFWWAYVKSPSFLREIPTGSGGTRPRVSPELLGDIRVNVPDEDKRFEIDNEIKMLAKQSWSNYMQNKKIFENLRTEYAG